MFVDTPMQISLRVWCACLELYMPTCITYLCMVNKSCRKGFTNASFSKFVIKASMISLIYTMYTLLTLIIIIKFPIAFDCKRSYSMNLEHKKKNKGWIN